MFFEGTRHSHRLTDSPIGTELDEQQHRSSCNWIALQISLIERCVTKKQMKDDLANSLCPMWNTSIAFQSGAKRSIEEQLTMKPDAKSNTVNVKDILLFIGKEWSRLDSCRSGQTVPPVHLCNRCLAIATKSESICSPIWETCLSPSPSFLRQSNLFVSVCWTSDFKIFFRLWLIDSNANR